ncbi:hypothetical protein [Rhodopila sp.]|uniref:hypothetical protein n=1 Tax=Rhodopila sp. TaxID=2480087 RepID=UPI003D13A5E0
MSAPARMRPQFAWTVILALIAQRRDDRPADLERAIRLGFETVFVEARRPR